MSEEQKQEATPVAKKEPEAAGPTFTLSMLKEILAQQSKQQAEQLKTVIAELKKPTEIEQKKLDEEAKAILQRNEERKENAAGMLQKIENAKWVHKTCTHKHRDGHSHCVLIHEKNTPGYILCQKEQCKIRPGVAPKDYKETDIYDTELFNRLLQELPGNELFG